MGVEVSGCGNFGARSKDGILFGAIVAEAELRSFEVRQCEEQERRIRRALRRRWEAVAAVFEKSARAPWAIKARRQWVKEGGRP